MMGYPGYAPPPYADRPEAEGSRAREEAARHQDDDPHLRSCNAVLKFHIEASDGDIGHVSDLLVDDETSLRRNGSRA